MTSQVFTKVSVLPKTKFYSSLETLQSLQFHEAKTKNMWIPQGEKTVTESGGVRKSSVKACHRKS